MANSQYYGSKDKAFVKQKQKELGVKVDGIWGPKTEAAYQSTVAKQSTAPSTPGMSQSADNYISYVPKTNAQADTQVQSELSNYFTTAKTGLDNQQAANTQAYTGRQADVQGNYDKTQAEMTAANTAEQQRQAADTEKRGLTASTNTQNLTGEQQARATAGVVAEKERNLNNIRAEIANADTAMKQAYMNFDTEKMNMAKARKYELQGQEENLLMDITNYNNSLKNARNSGGSGGRSPKEKPLTALEILLQKLQAEEEAKRQTNLKNDTMAGVYGDTGE